MTRKEKFYEIKADYLKNRISIEEYAVKDFGMEEYDFKTSNPQRYSSTAGHGKFQYLVDITCGRLFPSMKRKRGEIESLQTGTYHGATILIRAYIEYIEQMYEELEDEEFEDILMQDAFDEVNKSESLYKRSHIEYDGEDKLNLSDMSFMNDVGVKYNGVGILYAMVTNRRSNLNHGAIDKLTWLFVLDSMEQEDYKHLLYRYIDEDGSEYNYGGIEVFRKVFHHPLFDCPFPNVITRVNSFPKRLDGVRERAYKKEADRAKQYVEYRKAPYITRNPFTCGHDLSIALLMYKIYARTLLLTNKWEKHTQAGIANFLGYKSHAQFKAQKQEYETKLRNETWNDFELRYLDDIILSYQTFVDTYVESQNLLQETMENILQNENARNSVGAMYYIQALQRDSFEPLKEEKEETVVNIQFDNKIFETGN